MRHSYSPCGSWACWVTVCGGCVKQDRSHLSKNEITQDGREEARLEPPTEAGPSASGNPPRWLSRRLSLAVLLILFVVMLYLARRVLGPFIIAGILAYIFSGGIDNLQERLHWPRALIVSLLYLLVLGVLGVVLYFGAENLYRQTREFISGGPNILERGLQQIMGSAVYQFGGQTIDARVLA